MQKKQFFSKLVFQCLYTNLVNRLGSVLFFHLSYITVYNHLLYSHYQTTYIVWIKCKENLHADKLAGAERVN